MNIEPTYVDFNTAKLLKEKGFEVPCNWHYTNKGEMLHGFKEPNGFY